MTVGVFFANLVVARREQTYRGSLPLVVYGAMTAAIIAVITLVHGAAIYIPTYLWSLGLMNVDPEVYRMVWWGLGHSSQQINVAAMVAIWYMLGALTIGSVVLNEKISRSAFVLYILFISMASAHHLLVDPGMGPAWKVVNTSYFMYMAVLASMIHGFTVPAGMELGMRLRGFTNGMFDWLRRAPWGDPGFSSLVFSLFVFGFVGGITGVTIGTEQINIIVHNTLRVPGHFHATVASGTAMAFMGATYYLVPLIFQRKVAFWKLAKIQPYLFAGGMLIFTLSMTFAGTFGVPRRHWDITFSQAPFDVQFNPIVDLVLAVVAIGGVLAATGAFAVCRDRREVRVLRRAARYDRQGRRHGGRAQRADASARARGGRRRPERRAARRIAGHHGTGAGHDRAGVRLPRGLHPLLLRELEDVVVPLEDWVSETGRARAAVTVLAIIVAITASWWALALWPVGAEAPGWLLRTREVCFGSRADTLPSAAGWLLLVGQPVSMVILLVTIWGEELRAGLTLATARAAGQLALGVGLALVVAGLGAVVVRVHTANAEPFATGTMDVAAQLTRVSDVAPAVSLTDQFGREVSLESFRGRPVIVTFAFAHCETVCPLIVADVLAARRRIDSVPPPVLVVTLDPWRDTPSRLGSIATSWRLDPDAHVSPVLRTWWNLP